MNTPNKLTLVRLLTVPFLIIALYIQTKEALYIALILLLIAWITDILDGHLAEKRRLITKQGAFFDPVVDKVLVSFAFIVLGDLNIIPMWLVILMLFRDYVTQAVRGMAVSKGIILKSEWSGKIKFGLQIATIIFATFLLALSHTFEGVKEWMFTAIFWAMVITTAQAYYALFEFLYKNRQEFIRWF